MLKRRLLQLCILGAVTVMLAGSGVYVYYRDLADRENIALVGEMPQRSLVYDRHDQVIGRLHGANRIVVPLKGISPYFRDALLAREDSRFYRHGGIDYLGVARAIVRNLKDAEFTQGASTLTMQLARVSFDIREKTLQRKFLEAMLALRIESTYTKDDILSFYANRIYFGTGLYGVERASDAYFGKPASKLGLSEAAMLAGIIRAPNRFSPFRHYELALRERNMVLDRMLEMGYITPEEAAGARLETVAIRSQKDTRVLQNSYALDIVRRDLDHILEKRDMEDGGLLIYTTLDAGLQAKTEQALETKLSQVEKNDGYTHQTRADYLAGKLQGIDVKPEYLQGAAVVIDNGSGGIRAIVGGRNFRESQYNRATMSRRQIGSLFKPFVFAAAYERGLFPGTLVSDERIRRGEIEWTPGRYWSPNNSDGQFLGLQPAELGLIKSRNTMTVRAGEIAGFESVTRMAQRVGLTLPKEKSPQLYIGNLGADLKTVTSAFSAFAQDGRRPRPFVIGAIMDQRGTIIYRDKGDDQQLIPKHASWMTNQTLQKVIAPGGTAVRARSIGFKGPAAGKTGTTDAYRDAWFVGYTDKLTCGVWVGMDKPKTIMDRGYGSTLAVPVWADLMKHATENGYPAQPFQSDLSLVNVEVCRHSGGLANWACNHGKHAYQIAIPYEMVPRNSCHIHGQGFNLARTRPNTRPQQNPGLLERLRGLLQGQ